MDGLISLLIVFGISALLSSGKRKKAQQKRAQKVRAFRDAAEVMKASPRPHAREEWEPFPAEPEGPVLKPAAPLVQTPAVPEASIAPIVQAAPQKKAPIVQPAPKQMPAVQAESTAPEGSVSTQGESDEEHAKHRQRILAQEEKLRSEQQAQQEARSMNLQALRTAVVMREILDRPVSLRRRRS